MNRSIFIKYAKKSLFSFMISAMAGMLVLLIIETISRACGNDRNPLTPEFLALFPSDTIAFGVDILLYGMFGLAFAGWSFLYEIDRLGFVVQNMLYMLGTGIIWIPIVMLMWKLYKYPPAMIFTIAGFVVTHIIMSIIIYNNTKKEVNSINLALASQNNYNYPHPDSI